MPARQSPKVFIILITAPTKKEAKSLASKLIKNRLAACVNIVSPIQSLFRWRGKIESSSEALLIVKSAASKFSAIEKLIKKNHSYEVPEIIGWPIRTGSKSYLNWIYESLF